MTSMQVAPHAAPRRFWQSFEPTSSRVVIVCSGIHDRVRWKILGKMRVVRISVKSKLQHSGSRNIEFIAEFANVGSDQSKIFGDKWQAAHFFPDHPEKFGTGAGRPLPR